MKRSTLLLMLLPASLWLGGCSMLPTQQGNLYDMRREAQAAYVGNQDERAEKLLLGLSRAVPNDPETWFYLGNLYARTNRPDQAVDAYQKALMLNGGDPRAWHNLGVVRLRQAWAAFIQADDLTRPGDPLHARADAIIGTMEKMPLEGLKRPPPHDAKGQPKQ
jgi:cytochrome c-type biogenesis protein CcmH/NrfG